jgi:methionine sulfoxide reductase heme-binding subunit
MTISFSGPGLWYATRAAGLVALLLLTMSVLLGVLTAGRFSSPRWPRFLTVGLHRNLSVIALVFLALHVGTTVLDSYTSIQLSAAFIPFISSYKRGWLGLGAIALDLLIALVVTSLTRIRLGHRAWRLVHWSGYACWPVAVAHGVGAGTDEGTAWAADMTIACVAAVAGTIAWRVLRRWPQRRVLR